MLQSHSFLLSPARGFLLLGPVASPAHENRPPGCQVCDPEWPCTCQERDPGYSPAPCRGGLKTRTILDEVMGRAAASRLPHPRQPKQHVVTQLCHPHQGPVGTTAGTCSMDGIPHWNSATLVTRRGWGRRCVVQNTDTQQNSGRVWGG